jgi:hypothetical protein
VVFVGFLEASNMKAPRVVGWGENSKRKEYKEERKGRMGGRAKRRIRRYDARSAFTNHVFIGFSGDASNSPVRPFAVSLPCLLELLNSSNS